MDQADYGTARNSFHLSCPSASDEVASYQSRADDSTTYDDGQRGLAAAASFIQSRTDSDDLISSMKDVGLLAERRYVENYSAVYGGEKQARRLIERWEPGKIRLIVFTEGIPP
jgi:hypothetical protein